MNDYRIGQKVVCVNDYDNIYLRKGDEYTITGFAMAADRPHDTPGLFLAEVAHKPDCTLPFFAYRFRPIVERKATTETGMQILFDIRDGKLDPGSERERRKKPVHT